LTQRLAFVCIRAIPEEGVLAEDMAVYSGLLPRYPENERAVVTKVELTGVQDLELAEVSLMGTGLGLAAYPPDEELRDYDADLHADWMSRKSLDEVVLEPGSDDWSVALVVRKPRHVDHAWSENMDVHFERADGGGAYIGQGNTELHLVSDEPLCESALDDED
jgi:hypothetical protein